MQGWENILWYYVCKSSLCSHENLKSIPGTLHKNVRCGSAGCNAVTGEVETPLGCTHQPAHSVSSKSPEEYTWVWPVTPTYLYTLTLTHSHTHDCTPIVIWAHRVTPKTHHLLLAIFSLHLNLPWFCLIIFPLNMALLCLLLSGYGPAFGKDTWLKVSACLGYKVHLG